MYSLSETIFLQASWLAEYLLSSAAIRSNDASICLQTGPTKVVNKTNHTMDRSYPTNLYTKAVKLVQISLCHTKIAPRVKTLKQTSQKH